MARGPGRELNLEFNLTNFSKIRQASLHRIPIICGELFMCGWSVLLRNCIAEKLHRRNFSKGARSFLSRITHCAHIFITRQYFRSRLQRAKRESRTQNVCHFFFKYTGRGLVRFCRRVAGCRFPRGDSVGSEWKQKRDVKVNYTKSRVSTYYYLRSGSEARNVSLRAF